jgi:PKD repeat protein
MKRIVIWILPLLLGITLVVCNQVDFTATEGSEIKLTAQPLSINLGSTAHLTVTGTRDNGAPLPDGTVIRFVINDNLGAITPNPTETKNGIATATFIAGQRSGTASITAISGNISSDEVAIDIGEARVSLVILTADPAALPPEGGKIQLRAFVRDEQGNPVSGVQVFFRTTGGTLSSHGQPVLTNASGVAKDTLNTQSDATVTATVGQTSDQLDISLGTQVAPTCGSVVSPMSAAVNQDISFADDSEEGNSTLRTSSWNFGDGRSATGFVVTHSYSSAGTFIVLHTITDSQGLSDSCTPITVEIQEGQPPTCSFAIAPSGDVDVGQQVSFVDTSTDPDGSITNSEWDFGDGKSTTGFSVTHTYTTGGSFIVRHTATDDQGISASCTQTVNVIFSGTPPICAFSSSVPLASLTATFDGSASADTDENGASITAWDWTFGDNGTGTGKIVQHTYAGAGTFNVVLTVTDDEGDTDTCTHQVTVPGT